MSSVIEKAYTKAKEILVSNRSKLDALASELLQHEVIYKEDVEKILGPRPGAVSDSKDETESTEE